MKPIIQRPLDALEARIRALEAAAGRLLAAVTAAALRSGTVLGVQLLTGSGTYVPTTGTRRLLVRMVGGGGGGGGAAGGANVASASGGGSGMYMEFTVGDGTAAVAGGAYSCGLFGNGGIDTGGTGATGGNTTVVLNGTTYTARGGTGGSGQANTASSHAPAVGRVQGGSPSLDTITFVGEDGDHGVYANTDGYFWGGAGGSNPLGAGGGAVDGGNFGRSPFGWGAGGGGGCATTVGKSGGNGGNGVIMITEFS